MASFSHHRARLLLTLAAVSASLLGLSFFFATSAFGSNVHLVIGATNWQWGPNGKIGAAGKWGAVLGTDDPRLAELEYPSFVPDYDGGWLIVDAGNNRILRLPPDAGEVELLIGRANGRSGRQLVEDDPRQTALRLDHYDYPQPVGDSRSIIVEPDGSRLIVDVGNGRILRLSADSRRVRVVIGSPDAGSGKAFVSENPLRTGLKRPVAVVRQHDGSHLIVDSGNHRILRLAPDDCSVELLIGKRQRHPT